MEMTSFQFNAFDACVGNVDIFKVCCAGIIAIKVELDFVFPVTGNFTSNKHANAAEL